MCLKKGKITALLTLVVLVRTCFPVDVFIGFYVHKRILSVWWCVVCLQVVVWLIASFICGFDFSKC
jgi:hypothetical protein